MNLVTFSFNGINASIYYVILGENNHLDKPVRKIELITIPGRSDPLIVSDGTKENLILNMTLYIEDKNNIGVANLISQVESWLLLDEYKDLIFSDGVKFKAIAITGLTTEIFTDNILIANISFSCKDY